MFALLKQFADNVIAAFQSFWNWISNGLYDFMTWAFAGFVEYSVISAIKLQIWVVGFAWDVAKQILVDLGFASHLGTAWAALPSGVSGLLAELKVPQAVTLLITALVARVALRLIPGFK